MYSNIKKEEKEFIKELHNYVDECKTTAEGLTKIHNFNDALSIAVSKKIQPYEEVLRDAFQTLGDKIKEFIASFQESNETNQLEGALKAFLGVLTEFLPNTLLFLGKTLFGVFGQ